MKANESGIIEVKRQGICIRIRPTLNKGSTYYVVDYNLRGQRKLVMRNTLEKAQIVANDAIDKIAAGESEILDLNSSDKHIYVRACEAALPTGKPIDIVCRDHAEILSLLSDRNITPLEVVRDWLKRQAAIANDIGIAEAVAQLLKEMEAEKKSDDRRRQIRNALDELSAHFSGHTVRYITPNLFSLFLASLPHSDRTIKNRRDALGYFNRWLCLREYLAKGTNWFEGIPRCSERKEGEIAIYDAVEMRTLLNKAVECGDLNVVAFLSVGGFSGLRHIEMVRIQSEAFDLPDSLIKVDKKIGKQTRNVIDRYVPISANLRAWLSPILREKGSLLDCGNANNEVLKLAEAAGVPWKHNGLRHSRISYRLAEVCGDISKVADESGNSPAKIKTNYLQRVKPAKAAEWFNIFPTPAQVKRLKELAKERDAQTSKTVQLATSQSQLAHAA